MLFRTLSRRLLVAALLVLAAVPVARVYGQTDPNVQRGFAPDKVFAFGDLDSVNLFNGNLTLTLPLGGSYPVSGSLSYGLGLSYNSNVWDFESVTYKINGLDASFTRADPSKESNAGLGWTLSLGKLYAKGTGGSDYWRYLDEAAGEHLFYPTLHASAEETSSTTVFYTRDGSYLRLKLSAATSPLSAEVQFPDGRSKVFTRTSGTAPFRLGTIKDLFGHQVLVSYPTAPGGYSSRWQIADGFRTHYVDFKLVNGMEAVFMVDLAAFDGDRQIYDFVYSSSTISRSCLDDDPEAEGGTLDTAAVALLASVTARHDGSRYSFPTYNTTCFDGGTEIKNLPGTLAKMTLPTLGQLEWSYQTYTFPSRGPGCGPGGPGISFTSVTGVKTKRVLNASGVCETWDGIGCQWTYTPVAGTPRTTTVMPPTGDKVVHYFTQSVAMSTSTWDGWQYGLPISTTKTNGSGASTRYISREIYDGATKVRSVYQRYEHDKLPSSTCLPETWYNTNRRVASDSTVYDTDGGKFAEVTHSSFDGLGHYRQSTTSGSFGAGDVRSSFADYNPERGTYFLVGNDDGQDSFGPWPTSRNWVLGTAQTTSVTEGGVTAKSDYCYEFESGISQDQMNGRLLRKRVMKGASPGANDLVTRYAWSGGNLTEEHSHGGDKVPVGTTADLCALSLGTDQYYVKHTYTSGVRATSAWMTSSGAALAGGSLLNLTIDPNTGLPSSSTDAAGVRTDLVYDLLGRPTAEKPTPGNGAWTEYKWFKATSATSQARVEVYKRPNNSTTTNLAQSRIYFDPHGRPWRDWVLGANGVWATVDTGWNSMGWKRSVSERQPVPPANATQFKSFDPFGRPTLIVPPDGTTHQVTLAYTGDRVVSRTVFVNEGAAKTSATTTEQYDRQGRLWKVTEPSGTGGAQVTTTYGYDVGGRLASVSTTGQGRTFSYDNRGFLAWERHPEKGVSGNGYVRYLDYDALGNVGRKLDAVGTASATTGADSDLTFTYDRLSRLTQVRATGGSTHKAFTYGTGGTTKDAGKVLTADRYNYIKIGTTDFTVQVKETYAYAGVGGAVSSRTTQVYVNGGAAESFTQGWSWNDLGDVTTLTYPRCTHAGCSGGAATSRNVGFGYTNGFLTSVPNYASSISYHPNGMVNQVAHTNGVTWTQAAAPYGMARPASYATTGATSNNWTSGTYVYDGAGNVTAIGTSTFSYDAVSRLTASSLKTGVVAGSGTTATQTAAYDAVGNITSMATNGASLTLTTSASTNRLSSSTYDTMGSMATWSGNAYLYDDFAMAWRVTASGVAYQHLYTADDERIWTFQSGAPSRWTLRDLDGSVLRELKNNAGTWTVERDYVHRDGTLLAAVTTTETTHFHPDHLGTPRLITGTGGAYRSYHAYHPYGTEATAFNQDGERRKFTGHERDLGITTSTADDLDYMHARFYNMQIGRFTSVDPIGGSARVPQSWNRFSYVRGKAMTHYDPTGMLDVGFSASIAVASVMFYDEITVVDSLNGAAPGPGAAEAQGTTRIDNATFGNFLFGNHSGGGGSRSQHNRNRNELGFSVREYANYISAQGGAGSCASYSCQVLAGVGELAPFAEALDQAAIEMSLVFIPGPIDNTAYRALKVGAKFTPEQQALVALAKEAARKGVTRAEAKILREWAKEFGLPSRGPEAHPGRPYGSQPHLHIGPVNHIKVSGG